MGSGDSKPSSATPPPVTTGTLEQQMLAIDPLSLYRFCDVPNPYANVCNNPNFIRTYVAQNPAMVRHIINPAMADLKTVIRNNYNEHVLVSLNLLYTLTYRDKTQVYYKYKQDGIHAFFIPAFLPEQFGAASISTRLDNTSGYSKLVIQLNGVVRDTSQPDIIVYPYNHCIQLPLSKISPSTGTSTVSTSVPSTSSMSSSVSITPPVNPSTSSMVMSVGTSTMDEVTITNQKISFTPNPSIFILPSNIANANDIIYLECDLDAMKIVRLKV